MNKLVLLDAADVPPGSVVRHPNWPKDIWSLCNCYNDGLNILGLGWIGWAQLRTEGWLISRDFGKTWVKCEKEVEE